MTRNTWLKAAAAVRFRRFSFKLLEVRAAEFVSRRRALRSGSRPLDLPRSVIIRVTERCFLHCRMCGQNGDRGRLRSVRPSQRPIFDHRVLERVIDEIGRWPIKPFLKLTGGEPFVEREMTLAALDRASSNGLVTKLNTNGVLLADERTARRVASSGLDYLSISIDGPPDIHDMVRGLPGVYDRVIQGIRNVRRYGRQTAGRTPMVLVSAVVSGLNQDRVFDLAKRMDEEKIDWLNFEFMNFTTPALSESARNVAKDLFGTEETPWASFANPGLAGVDADVLAAEIRAVRRARFSIPISFLGIGDLSARNIADYYHNVDAPLRMGICAMPYAAAFLVPPARMVFCVDYPLHFYADLAKTSLAEGWHSEKAASFRRGLASYHDRMGPNFPQCRRCNWRFN